MGMTQDMKGFCRTAFHVNKTDSLPKMFFSSLFRFLFKICVNHCSQDSLETMSRTLYKQYSNVTL